jgi:hypothetical protein
VVAAENEKENETIIIQRTNQMMEGGNQISNEERNEVRDLQTS